MNANKRSTKTLLYPQSADEWQDAISRGLGLVPQEGKTRYQADTFPFDALILWIRREFGADKGYCTDFVPTLTRNIKGLVAWVYEKVTEPYWPGQDEDQLYALNNKRNARKRFFVLVKKLLDNDFLIYLTHCGVRLERDRVDE